MIAGEKPLADSQQGCTASSSSKVRGRYLRVFFRQSSSAAPVQELAKVQALTRRNQHINSIFCPRLQLPAPNEDYLMKLDPHTTVLRGEEETDPSKWSLSNSSCSSPKSQVSRYHTGGLSKGWPKCSSWHLLSPFQGAGEAGHRSEQLEASSSCRYRSWRTLCGLSMARQTLELLPSFLPRGSAVAGKASPEFSAETYSP